MFKLADGSCSGDYKIGDLFEVVVRDEDLYDLLEGVKVIYAEDDSSSCPKFVLEGYNLNTREYEEYYYIPWKNLKEVTKYPFPVGAKVVLKTNIGNTCEWSKMFTKGTRCIIFGYTEVCGESTPIIQDAKGLVTTCRIDLLKPYMCIKDNLIATLLHNYNCELVDELIRDIKDGKLKGLKYVGDSDV